MNNRGQTTVLFSLMISVLLLFTFTALEVIRIHMGKVKMMSCVHSMRSSIMADYNSELFERYHLLFMDPTYGTGSEALVEEKIEDYLDVSLNGEKGKGSGIYIFNVEEIAIADQRNILSEDMKQVKQQIADYEKKAGVTNRIKKLTGKLKEDSNDVAQAAKETEINGVELPISEPNSTAEPTTDSVTDGDGGQEEKPKVEDPRKTLKESLKLGTLAFVLPDSSISKEDHDFSEAPSAKYEEQEEEERDNTFQDIGFLKKLLKESSEEDNVNGLVGQAAFVDYVTSNFSNGVNQNSNSVMQCEVEYILKGKSNDYDNLQAVVDELTWMRMPINYAYLLTDTEKKSEALTMAAAICTAAGTPALTEVIKYLLLGCWAYGETLSEMKTLLAGEEIAYVKTKENWNTDLKNLVTSGTAKQIENGLSYEEYLMILLATKSGKKADTSYARMLDMIELNLQKEDPDFHLSDCVGALTIQGKITVNPKFIQKGSAQVYENYFEEEISY